MALPLNCLRSVCLPALLSAVVALAAIAAPAAPVLSIERSQLDAGKVLRGDDARYAFVVRNTGDATLTLDARPGCGCTVVEYDRSAPPGGSAHVSAAIHTAAFSGPISKLIDLSTNDPAHPNATLKMIADVISPVQILPTEYPLVSLAAHGVVTVALEVRFLPTEPGAVTSATCGVPYATATTRKMPVAADGGARFAVSVDIAARAPYGRAGFPVTIATTSPRMPQVSAYVTTEKGIIATPASAYLGAIGPEAPMPAAAVVLLTKAGGAFRVKGAACSDPRLSLSVEPVHAGREYRLTVTYRGGWPRGPVSRDIRVTTDDPDQPTLVVPVSATVLAAMRGR